MSEFNPDFERERQRVLETLRVLRKAQEEYAAAVAAFRAKYPRAGIPAE